MIHAYLPEKTAKKLHDLSYRHGKTGFVRKLIHEYDPAQPLDAGRTPVTLNITGKDLDRLDEIAKANGVSRSAAVALLIDNQPQHSRQT